MAFIGYRLLAPVIAAFFLISCSCGSGRTCRCDDADTALLESVDSLICGMTLEEKVCQMFVVRPEALGGETCNVDTCMFRCYPVGGVCLFRENITDSSALRALTSAFHSLRTAPLVCVDEEGGRVVRIAGNTSFDVRHIPDMASVALCGRDSVYAAALYIGSYLSRFGFDVDFAPVADVSTNPENRVIGARAFSSLPDTAAVMVAAYMEGLRDAGVISCLKHFPGHGDVSDDTHNGMATSGRTLDDMLECELKPFAVGIAAGAPMVMTAHISVPALTGDDSPASMSYSVVTELLREKLGFEGVIITDALEMGAVTTRYSAGEAAVMAVKAGSDMLLMPENLPLAAEAVIGAVRAGEIPSSRIDGSVRRIFLMKSGK